MADSAALAPATPKQPSRKGKRAWRKNVDLSEVQSGLETVRDEVIKGGVIAERPSEALFALDTAGDEEIAKKERTGKKLLKADEILAQRSAVPAVDGRKRKAPEGLVEGSSKKHKKGRYVSHKELQRLKSLADQTGGVAVEAPAASHDPWADNSAPKDPRFSYLDEKKPIKEPRTLKHAPVNLNASGKPTPHIRKPASGKSYNPLFDDWQAVLEREGAKVVSDEHIRLAVEATDAQRQRRNEEEAAKVEAQEKDEYATDYESAWESEWEGIQSEVEEQWVAKQQKRKTPAERNKVKARKEREAKEKWELKQKVRDEQQKRIKQIAKEVAAKDRLRQSRAFSVQPAELDSSADENEALQRRRFGKVAIPEAPLEVVLPDELQDSLRRLKPEGNLLKDRYRNLLVNGKIEARRPVHQFKKPRREATEKWTYKDWKLV